MEGISPEQLREVIGTALWQFNEAVSLLRECRGFVTEPELVGEIDEGLPAIQSALESLATAFRVETERPHAAYDVALPEIEEWVNRNGNW